VLNSKLGSGRRFVLGDRPRPRLGNKIRLGRSIELSEI
jgi:hypothetical protein